jgi:hypothetical protein
VPLPALVVLGVLHHHTQASGVDYVGVFLAAGASWFAIPGPGEAALIAAGRALFVLVVVLLARRRRAGR